MTIPNRHEQQRQLSHQELRKAQRQSTAISSIIISMMMTLVAFGYTEMAKAFIWPVTPIMFIPFIFFTALETLYAKEIENRILEDYGKSGFFRIAEIILLAVLLRGALMIFGTPGAKWSAFTQNLSEPLAAWFVPEYTLSLYVLIMIWGFMLFTYQDMKLLYNLEEYTDWDQIGKQQANLMKKRTAFLNRFIFLGVGVLLGMTFSAGSWVGSGTIRFTFNGEPLNLILVVMGYFLLLLLLMSQTQLARLRTRWWLNNSAVNPRVQRNWTRASLYFFCVAALIALISPTGFAEQVFSTLQSILLLLMTAVQFIVAIVFLPISLLIGLLFPTMQQSEGEETPVEIPPTLQETAEQLTAQTPAWIDTASDVIVWVLLGGVIVFALVQYLRQDRSLTADIGALFRRIGNFLQNAWASLHGGMEEFAANVQRRRRLRQAERTVMDLPVEDGEVLERNIGLPRKEVFRIYQRLLTHGRNIGKGRKTSQTPLQYEQNLAEELADTAVEPLHQMTEIFDDARYSQRELTQHEADHMAKEWNLVREEMKKQDGD